MKISDRKLFRSSLSVALLSTVFALHAVQTTAPSLHQLPPAIQNAIKTQLGDDKLISIEKEEDDGEITYTVSRAVKGGERFFTLSGDGTLLGVEVSLVDTPPAVHSTIKTQVGQGTIESIEKTFEDNEVSYDVDFKKSDGTESSFSVGPDGKLTSVQLTLAEVPAAARKTIEAHVGEGKIGDVYKLLDGDEVYYDAEVEHGGKSRDVIVSPSGKLESIQVFLTEIPPEAQNTIKEKLGNGKLVRIDKSFTSRRGLEPFEIEGRKDGKPFNFSVGPKGRFLGMN